MLINRLYAYQRLPVQNADEFGVVVFPSEVRDVVEQGEQDR